MTKYPYMLIVAGQIEAKDREHAKLIVQMSFALVGRLLAQQHTISIQIKEPLPENGKVSERVSENG